MGMANQSESRRLREVWALSKRYAICYLPVVVFALVYLVYVLIYRSSILCAGVAADCASIPPIQEYVSALVNTSEPAAPSVSLQSFSGRMGWGVSVGLSLFFTLIVFATASLITGRARFASRWSYVIPFVAAIALAWVFVGLSSVEDAPESPWRQFVHAPMEMHFAHAELWTRILDLTGLVAAAYLVISVSVLFGTSVGREEEWRRDLSTHARILNTALYLGAALLVTGIYRIWALLSWSLDYIDPGGLAESQRQILEGAATVAMGIVNSRGVLYTMLLAALYVPGLGFLAFRARQASAAGAWSESERQEWAELFSPREGLLRLIAILAPAITGPAADYLALLG